MTIILTAFRTRLRRAGGPEHGMGLTEVLVASMVLVIVLTVATSFFINAMKSVSLAAAANANNANAANGMNEAARVIRAGTATTVWPLRVDSPAFMEAKAESVILYSLVAADRHAPRPMLVRLSLDPQRQLVEERWAPSIKPGGQLSFPSPYAGTEGYTAPDSTRILTTTVSPQAGTTPHLFTYYRDALGTERLPSTGADVPAAQLSQIVAVKVTMTIQQSMTTNASPVTLENLVGIPNLNALAAVS